MRDYLHSGHDTRLCPDFKLSTTTSVEICGQGGLTMMWLMANGGALLNSIMGRVSKEPDIIFLQVSGNDFPRTAQNQRDADTFSLQLLELASLLNNRYKAKRVVVGCILPRSSARRFRRGFSPLEVMQLGASSQHRAYRAQPESATNSVSSSTSEWPSTSIDSLAGCWGP